MIKVILHITMSDRDQRFLEQITSATTQEVALSSQPILEEPVFSPSSPTRMQNIKRKIGRMQLFSAFCENPTNVSFQTQEPDEHILLFLRKSRIHNIPWIIMTILLLFIPPLIYLIRDSFSQSLPPMQAVIVLIPFYYLLVATYAFVNFITWYYNAALITDKRVVDIDFHQLVIKDVAETKLSLVQDVSYNQLGVIQNIFGFGHILIQTAGTLDNFEFYGLPQPSRIVEIVENLIGGGKKFYEQ